MKTSILVLVEVLIIIGLSRLVGLGFRYIKQPLVIGEIVAGIMLGPSLFGLLAPDLAAFIFPSTAVPFLEVLAEIGLIFFMFLIGLELDPKYLKGNLNIAVLVSHASILLPFSLGILLALLLYPLVSDASVSFTAFTLFLGSAMSITAFPVLARIITEKNLQGTRLGTLALTCAAVDDVTAWCLLALAIAVANTNSMVAALPTMAWSALYISLMLTVGHKFLRRLTKYYEHTKKINQFILAGIFMAVLGSALITELIGIHLIFGAFLMGVIMPKDKGFTSELVLRTEEFILIFLLPIFFAYSGLRTQIGLLNTPELWWLCGLILTVAIAGKYFGTYTAARFSGIDKREASALGWLMNTRGLTELIVLNIGLSLGVISPMLFTMLVIMALVTTFMTSPLIDFIYPNKPTALDIPEPLSDLPLEEVIRHHYQVLVLVANPNSQRGLMQLAVAIALPNFEQVLPANPPNIYLLNLIEHVEDYLFEGIGSDTEQIIQSRQQQLQSLISSLEPSELQRFVHPIVRECNEVAAETVAIAEMEHIDLIVAGWHRPVLTNNRLGGRVGKLLNSATTDIAVFIESSATSGNTQVMNKILVAYAGSIHDDLGLELAIRLLNNYTTAHLQIVQAIAEPEDAKLMPELVKILDSLPQELRDRIDISNIPFQTVIEHVIEASKNVDLTIAGTSREWGIKRQILMNHTDELAAQCQSSLLIVRKCNHLSSHLELLTAKS